MCCVVCDKYADFDYYFLLLSLFSFRLHDMDIITIAIMGGPSIPDAVSCYKFFQVRIPREGQALERARLKKAERIRKLQQGLPVDSDSDEDEDEGGVLGGGPGGLGIGLGHENRPKSNNSSRTKSASMQHIGSPITYHSQFHINRTNSSSSDVHGHSHGAGAGIGAEAVVGRHSPNPSPSPVPDHDPYQHLTDIQVFLLHTGGQFLSLQESCLFIMYGHHLIDMLIQCEKGRYHELHHHDVDRHLLPTLKSYETSEMAGLLSYEPDIDWIMTLQSYITWEEKAKVCYLLYGASVSNFYSDMMQRDQVFKGE